MASSDKKKPSASGQPNSAALVTVVGSDLDFYTNSNYLAYEAARYASAGSLGSNDIDGSRSEEDDEPDDPSEEDIEKETNEVGQKNTRPSLSDIEVISNEVVFDAAKNPTAKIVFKVKNSSGVELKAVDVRQEKK